MNKLIFLALPLLILLTCCTSDSEQDLKLNSLLDKIKPTTETFKIKPQRDTLLTTKNLVSFFIPKNSLIYKNGSLVKEDVQFKVDSYNSLAEILGEGLSTYTDNGELLVTEGMFQITATVQSKQEVQIKTDNPWRIEVPKTNSSIRPSLFSGENTNNVVQWKASAPQVKSMVPIPIENFLSKDIN